MLNLSTPSRRVGKFQVILFLLNCFFYIHRSILWNILESIIDNILHDVLIGKTQGGSGDNEEREVSEATSYLQDPVTSVSQTDNIGGEQTERKEKNRSFRFWTLTITVISLLFIALIVGLSLYFGLYFEKRGNYWQLTQNFYDYFSLESVGLINSTSSVPGKYSIYLKSLVI